MGIVALIWVASSFVVQGLQNLGVSPFLLTYISNSMFVVLLPVAYYNGEMKRARSRVELPDEDGTTPLAPSTASANPTLAEPANALEQTTGDGNARPSTFMCALYVSPLWFLAQFTFNASLGLTSVSSNTILSNVAGLFTYAFSVWFLREAFDIRKAVAVVVCAVGAALVTVGDASGSERAGDTVRGDLVCLLSAVFYAAYTTALRYFLPDDESCSMCLFFGYVGLVNLVALFPVVSVGYYAGYMPIEAGGFALLGALCKGLFDNVFSDYLWARAVLLCGPTVATVSLTSQVPLSIFAEVMLGRFKAFRDVGPGVAMVTGTLAIVAGVFGINALSIPHVDPAASGAMF